MNNNRPPPVQADINLAALGDNLRQLRHRLPPRTAIWAVVKNDAYGHGAAAVADYLQTQPIGGLVVNDPVAGSTLRQAGIDRPILVLEPPRPNEPSDACALATRALTATITSLGEADAVNRAALHAGRLVRIHIRVDTGFAGLGVPLHRLGELLSTASRMPGLQLEGMFTHLCAPYHGDHSMTAHELERFSSALTQADAMGLRPPLVHTMSSPALADDRLIAAAVDLGCTMVRPGSALYGIHMGSVDALPSLTPAMTVIVRISRVIQLQAGSHIAYSGAINDHELHVAILPLGFYDAPYLLWLRNGGVLIHGHWAPMIGQAFMNVLLVDVSAIRGVRAGDEAVLIGRQGNRVISLEELAAQSGIPPSAIPFFGPQVIRCHRNAGPRPPARDPATSGVR